MSVDTAMHERQRLREEVTRTAGSGDVGAMLQSLRRLLGPGKSAGDLLFAAARLKELDAASALQAGLKPLRTYITRSITVEPLLPTLLVEAALSGFCLNVEVSGYGSFIDDLMNPTGALSAFRPDLVLFLFDVDDIAGGLDDVCAAGIPENMSAEAERVVQRVSDILHAFRKHSAARLLVQGVMVPDQPVLGEVTDLNLLFGQVSQIRRINEGVASVCRNLRDAVYFDQDQVAARYGRAAWRDERMFSLARLPVSQQFFSQYAQALMRAVRALYMAPRKVLCTDLDDTFWGGIVGEDGPQGIVTGGAFPGNCFRQYQRFLKQLAARGVLLAIVSKNNEADVVEAFRIRSPDLALTLADFAATKFGWDDKVDSLRALSGELSLGLDSFVLVDDSPVECAAVRRQLPEVLVIEAPKAEPWRLVESIASLGAFDSLDITEEDRKRTSEYRAQVQRAQFKQSAESREDFLASLNIRCKVIAAVEAPLSRTVQLIGKTNQFNLTTRRHSSTSVEALVKEPGAIAVAMRLTDRFGDSGVIGVAMCQTQDQRCRIDTFLLSCRVIGRGVESAFLWQLANTAKENGARWLIGEYIPTAKNRLCAEFYPKHGFRPISTAVGSHCLYEFDLSVGLPEKPWWITLEQE